MAWKNVESYSFGYSLADQQFFVYFQLQDEANIEQFFPSAQDFVGLRDMFENAASIKFNTDGSYFATNTKTVNG
jgi:hypothetical protein